METNADVINFDAYQHADKVALYAKEFKAFLDRGGMLGWGIVPVIDEVISNENVVSLVDKLERGIDLFVKGGVDETLLASSSWISTSTSPRSST